VFMLAILSTIEYMRIPRGGVRVDVAYVVHHLYLRIPRGGVRVDVGYIIILTEPRQLLSLMIKVIPVTTILLH